MYKYIYIYCKILTAVISEINLWICIVYLHFLIFIVDFFPFRTQKQYSSFLKSNNNITLSN